ncbi:hypothetical protein ACG33_12005 [Steroidobacter denitrificans]|uniref:Uncharacterized protein n=1 Tax=Steroidobacter denitrificans TaxID=465721 RepID=A0A127FBL0_STEDE|nr:hypothetical protein ACG33_12005 [Steroidobacter denitrificans]
MGNVWHVHDERGFISRVATPLPRRLLCRVFHSQDFHGASLVQHAIEQDVIPVGNQLAHEGGQAWPAGATHLWRLCKRQGLVAQVLAELLGLGRLTLARVPPLASN